ncbi:MULTISPECIES: hypothetical protein [Cohnella]|uniref:hypothetical protein n=1 Tax=Cohnella TaxID=329857 RepID=UPI001F083DB9|nr:MULTISPECIES: hypothetical protein [Cohnella]
MIDQAFHAARSFGGALLLLDRYFLSIPALKCLGEGNLSGESWMYIVTKAKMNVVAYERPVRKTGRGRPAQAGKDAQARRVISHAGNGISTGQRDDLREGRNALLPVPGLALGTGPVPRASLCFGQTRRPPFHLVSTDLSLEGAEIITLYGYRFKIECTFREMKQVIGAFGYRFWSRSMPKLKRYLRKDEPHPLEQVKRETDRLRIRQTLQAIEGFVMCSVISTGIIQLITLRFSGRTPALFFRYLRTPSKAIVSEATVTAHLRHSIFRLFAQNRHLSVTQIIRSKQDLSAADADSWAS